MLRFFVIALACMAVLTSAHPKEKGHKGHHHKGKGPKGHHHHEKTESSSHHQEVTVSTVHHQQTVVQPQVREVVVIPGYQQEMRLPTVREGVRLSAVREDVTYQPAHLHDYQVNTIHRQIRLPSVGWKSLMDDGTLGYSVVRHNTSWTVIADYGSTVRVKCPIVRFPSSSLFDDGDCHNGRMAFNDGYSRTTYCGSPREYVYQSKSRFLDIDVELGSPYPATISCKCQSVPTPSYEVVHVEPESRLTLSYPQSRITEDKAWRFISTSNHAMTLDCSTRVLRSQYSTRREGCMSNILKIDSGKGPQRYCGKSRASAIGTDISLSLESFSDGEVTCVVQG